MSLKILLLCGILALSHAKSVIVGQTADPTVRLVAQKIFERYAIPLVKRTDEIQCDVKPPNVIRGISIRDAEDSDAEASIVGGGLGFGYVKIKLKSQRGSGYKYLVEIFE